MSKKKKIKGLECNPQHNYHLFLTYYYYTTCVKLGHREKDCLRCLAVLLLEVCCDTLEIREAKSISCFLISFYNITETKF